VARRAAIDVGTNSVRLLVAEVSNPPGPLYPLIRRVMITRLGEGLEPEGAIRPAAAIRTAAAIEECVALAASAGVLSAVIVGTYALRIARNPNELLARLHHPVRVLTGEEEAQMGFRGALAGLDGAGLATRALVVDIGGGSF